MTIALETRTKRAIILDSGWYVPESATQTVQVVRVD